MNRILNFYNNSLTLWVILCGGLAFIYPQSFLFAGSYISLFFSITMFGIGLVITKQDYLNIIRSPKTVLFGNLCQFTIMPLLGFVTGYIFRLPKAAAVGLVLAGCAPGAMTSNVITYLSKGDTAYSVSLTAVATILSPVLTPFLMLLLVGKRVPVEVLSMFKTIIITVVLPLIAGFFVRDRFPAFIKKTGQMPPTISVTAIVIITSYVIAANRERIGTAALIIFTAVIFHNIAGMVLGYSAGIIGGLSFRRKKTLSIEIGMQNAGMGVLIALEHFSAEVAIPAAIFTIWCIVSASVLVSFWKWIENLQKQAKVG